jgi:pimeloyl-ACP methyl ester carboxylesterase
VSWFPTTIPALARVADALLDDLGIERVDVLGYSFGGAVAQELALRSPGRLGALVLAATNCGGGSVPGDPAALAALVAPMPVRLLPPGRGSLLALSGDHGTRARFGRADTAWAARPPNPLGVWWQAVAIGAWTSAPWLARITTPTLVLTGADDRIVPLANARMLARRIPHATLRVVPDAGHFALLADDPGESGDAVEEFLRAHYPDVQDQDAQARGLLST